jgi:hypothetical protein
MESIIIDIVQNVISCMIGLGIGLYVARKS